MVNSCVVCGVVYRKDALVSFHRLPADKKLRSEWIQALNLNECELPKYPYVCSLHFSDSWFLQSPSTGKRGLKKGAVPRLHPVVSRIVQNITEAPHCSTYYPSSSEITERDPERAQEATLLQAIPEDDVRISQTGSTSSASDSAKLSQSTLKRKHSSSTLTATESEHAGEIFRTPPKRRKIVNKRYVGDWSSEASISPKKSKVKIAMMRKTLTAQTRKVKTLQQMNRRLRKKIVCMNSLLKYLTDNNYITENAQEIIKTTQPDDTGEIINKFLAGPSKAKYSPALRSFALTLHFYSAKAYNFIRQKFNKTLPHPRTIGKWYTSVDGSPGFTKEAKKALEMKVAEAHSNGRKILCNFVIDEMAIKKYIQWDGKKFCGYVNFGTDLDSDQLTQAREALVFMLVALNGRWKIPFGYFLLNGLAASEKANLIHKGLEFVHPTGVVVTSITFDGAATNISMISHLGGHIDDYLNLKTWINNPVSPDNIFIYLDPCHMLKLLRNCLGAYRQLLNGKGEIIDWSFIEKLVQLQEDEGLAMGTKLRQRHLNWSDQPMKVNLAAQTFSRSVADALVTLEHDYKLDEFQGASATAEFIRTINDLFDIFNSKNRLCKVQLRRGLSEDNKETVFYRLCEIKAYLLNLTLINKTSVFCCRRKTGFIGFLVCIESLMGMFKEYVEEKKMLNYILTYKISQDHIELFFCALRQRLGMNNNPTAVEFERCYKRLIVHTEISPSESGNAIALDCTTILSCSSASTLTKNNHGEQGEDIDNNIQSSRQFLEDHDYLGSESWVLTDYTKDIVAYIAGFVIKSLKRFITCDECLTILISDNVSSKLRLRKTYGRLYKPSYFTIFVCREGEKLIRYLLATSQLFLLDEKKKKIT